VKLRLLSSKVVTTNNYNTSKTSTIGCSLKNSVNQVCTCLSLMLRPTVSRPICLEIKHPTEAYDQNFITDRQLRICWCGALCLTRGRVYCLQFLLGLASAVIFGSDSLGTRDHILLSQIRRLLLLAGLRWRNSTRKKPSRIPFYLTRRPGYETSPWRILYFVSAATVCLSTRCHGKTAVPQQPICLDERGTEVHVY
jgi:hypothetical protein